MVNMKTEYYTTKWLRKLEIVSMVVAIIATPLIFIVLAVMALYSPVPQKGSNIIALIGVIMFFTTIFTIDLIFWFTLKHYLYHQEIREDVIRARLSSIFVLGDFVLYILLYILFMTL